MTPSTKPGLLGGRKFRTTNLCLIALMISLSTSPLRAAFTCTNQTDTIATHYSATINDFECGSEDEYTLDDGSPFGQPYVPSTNPTECHPVWTLGTTGGSQDDFYGSGNSYLAETFSIDTVAIGLGSPVEDFCKQVQNGIEVLSSSIFGPSTWPASKDPCTAQSEISGQDFVDAGLLSATPVNHVVVLHNLIVADSLISIFLPPGWLPAASGTHPIVVQVVDDLNNWVLDFGGNGQGPTSDGSYMAGLIDMSVRDTTSSTGAIGLMWNGGSPVGSSAVHTDSHGQFEEIIEYLHDHFGGNKDEVFMYGGSRSGGSALRLASNLGDKDYTVKLVAASAAPTSWGATFARLINTPTYPSQYFAIKETLGMHNAAEVGFTYPGDQGLNCAGVDSNATGLSAAEATVRILSGIYSPTSLEDIDEFESTSSDDWVAALEAQGTKVFLEVGTHDKVPYRVKADYIEKLAGSAVDFNAEIQERAGHGRRPLQAALPPIDQKQTDVVWNALKECLDSASCSVSLPKALGNIDYCAVLDGQVTQTGQRIVTCDPNRDRTPFTLEFPRVVPPETDFPMIVSGPPNSEFKIERCSTDSPAICGVIASATLGSALEIDFAELTLTSPACATSCDYTIRFFGETDPVGAPGVLQQFTKTPSDSGVATPTMTVEAPAPDLDIETYALSILDEIPDSTGQVNWGISEN